MKANKIQSFFFFLLISITPFTLTATLNGCASNSKKEANYPDDGESAHEVEPVVDKVALDELKKMSNVLSKAKTLTFVATTMTPIRGANLQWVHVFTNAEVKVQRPNKIVIESGGDAFPQKIFFDGALFSKVATQEKLYSQKSMSGTIDTMLSKVSTLAGESLAFGDVLLADPYLSWTHDLTAATYIGETDFKGEKLQHVALAAKDVEWEVWMDHVTHLPRMVYVKYTGQSRAPSTLIEFSRWEVDRKLSVSLFKFQPPQDFKMIEIKAPKEGLK